MGVTAALPELSEWTLQHEIEFVVSKSKYLLTKLILKANIE